MTYYGELLFGPSRRRENHIDALCVVSDSELAVNVLMF